MNSLLVVQGVQLRPHLFSRLHFFNDSESIGSNFSRISPNSVLFVVQLSTMAVLGGDFMDAGLFCCGGDKSINNATEKGPNNVIDMSAKLNESVE